MNAKTLQKMVARSYRLLPRIAHSGNRHFSYILDGNDVLSYGINDVRKTHPLAIKYKYPYVHSELSAVVNWGFYVNELRGLKMVNVRIGNCGQLKMSRPCSSCQRFLSAFEFKEIWYTNENGEFEQL